MTGRFTLGSRIATRLVRRTGTVAVLAASLSLGACAGDLGFGGGSEPELSVADKGGGRPQSELEKATEYWGKQVVQSPRDGKAVLNYARNLKAMGRKQEALQALQASYIYNGDNREYVSEYGRLALELGQVGTAASLLERADDPAKPDWRVVSARGTALAKQGKYKEAVAFFERARELAPQQASVLNNLAMAYAMDGQAEKAEGMLRDAAAKENADPKIRQNLALVRSLQGKPEEDPSAAGNAQPAPAVASAASMPRAQPAAVRAGTPGTAPIAPVESAPIDPEAIIKAATEAEAAKNRKASSPVSTSSTKGARRPVQTEDEASPRLRQARP